LELRENQLPIMSPFHQGLQKLGRHRLILTHRLAYLA
jgi:hypothetical protein